MAVQRCGRRAHGIVTSLFQAWEWIPASLSDINFSLEQGGGGFLALQGWICDNTAINLTSANIPSLKQIDVDELDDPLLDNCEQGEVDDPGSLPPTSDDLSTHVYDYNVVSSMLFKLHHPAIKCLLLCARSCSQEIPSTTVVRICRRAQVYSHVYNVPVLFLRGRRASGAPLSPEQVWADMAR